MTPITVPPAPIGRFAPSPTGLLHLGSLFTALASFLAVRAEQGLWRVRIDDLDTPRNVKGSDTAILQTLEAFELYWDGPVAYQSQHISVYQEALQQLAQQNLLYHCRCSRKQLASAPINANTLEVIYPGYCLDLSSPPTSPTALRVKTPTNEMCFQDLWQGKQCETLRVQHGDFVVRRKDQIIAYQLAVVLDDYLQGVTQVIRGADLLSSTLKQRYLQECLTLPAPVYGHVPLICNPDGSKLSKKAFAPAVSQHNKQQILFGLLQLLQQQPPDELLHASVSIQLQWAIAHWNPSALHQQRTLNAPTDFTLTTTP